MNRRHFLRSAGVALALPWLEARGAVAVPRRRMICLCAPLGLHPAYFFPEKTGREYGSTPYLDVLKDFRKDFTVVSGLSHAGMSPGFAHQASASFLTGAQGAGRPGFQNEVSLTSAARRASPAWSSREKAAGCRGRGPARPSRRRRPRPGSSPGSSSRTRPRR